MTGFGAAEGTVGSARVTVELRSVNHRFFNATIKLPAELSRWEGEVREALRKRLSRGHVTLNARSTRGVAGPPSIDEERFAAYVGQLRDLKNRYGLDGDVDVATVLQAARRDVVDQRGLGGRSVGVPAARRCGRGAASPSSRRQEGERLGTYLIERLVDRRGSAGAHRRARAGSACRAARPSPRSDPAADRRHAVDEQRLAQEIAILADRLDVQEELSRFRSHFAAFRESRVRRTGGPVGKRLGFLLQEMLREANTTGSKANDAAMLADVVTSRKSSSASASRWRTSSDPVPAHPLGAVGRRQDDDREAAARAAAGRRLLGLLHDASARGRTRWTGKDYFFLSRPSSWRERERGEFAESAEVHGNLYGTLRSEVERVLGAGQARRHGHRRAGRAAVRGRLPRVGARLPAAAVRPRR